MVDQEMIERIVAEVLSEIGGKAVSPIAPQRGDDRAAPAPIPAPSPPNTPEPGSGDALDLASPAAKAVPLLQNPEDYDALIRMKSKTSARIGVGKCGPRLNTKTLLTLRADHAAARDAVFTDVDQAMLDRLGLFTVQTKCADKNQFLTRPDLGRQFSGETLETLRSKCRAAPDVQIYASDGLSSTAVNANLPNILPVLTDGLTAKGLTLGTPFFVKYGRVPAMDAISECLGATVTCVLLGERPGLATAESMSAYICYKATVGMPEARRTVVSNIHKGGISAVEAGAYICDVIEAILAAKASGVDLKK